MLSLLHSVTPRYFVLIEYSCSSLLMEIFLFGFLYFVVKYIASHLDGSTFKPCLLIHSETLLTFR